jgi:FtsP/CotA-like multicopper oxidase with cupredoxin domain
VHPQQTAFRQMVRVDLEARPTQWEVATGLSVPGYGFNGQVPGPTIQAEVGDTLVVRLANALPEPTTIHWHGLRVPADMDGTELVQHPIQPGGTFEYRFVLPDAGTFWYHPHTHEIEQLEKGLYGALVVRGPDEPRLDGERVLVLDDLKLDRHGNLARFGGWKERHQGRLGEIRLVNGRTQTQFEMAAGQLPLRAGVHRRASLHHPGQRRRPARGTRPGHRGPAHPGRPGRPGRGPVRRRRLARGRVAGL